MLTAPPRPWSCGVVDKMIGLIITPSTSVTRDTGGFFRETSIEPGFFLFFQFFSLVRMTWYRSSQAHRSYLLSARSVSAE